MYLTLLCPQVSDTTHSLQNKVGISPWGLKTLFHWTMNGLTGLCTWSQSLQVCHVPQHRGYAYGIKASGYKQKTT